MRLEDIQVEPAFRLCTCSPSHAATVCQGGLTPFAPKQAAGLARYRRALVNTGWVYLEQIKLVSRAFVGAPFLALQSALNQEECSLVGGRRSCRTRRRTVLKPQYFYMHNIIEWYRNVIQRMHAYQWQQLEHSWCGAWLGPVP